MKKKVEDILTKENISIEDIRNIDDLDPKSLQKANDMYAYLKTPKHQLSASEKNKIKTKIANSVARYERSSVIKWFAAASILAFCSLGTFHLVKKPSVTEIASYAGNIQENKKDTVTRLVLDEGREIQINENESLIEYSAKGEEIEIGSTQKVHQELKPIEPKFNTVVVPYGKRVQITLSEGTRVWLNSGSKFVYPAIFKNKTREVYIDGEAAFNVSKDAEKPFVVRSKFFNIEVLGTVFDVCSYADDTYSNAVLLEGQIKLTESGKSIITSKSQLIKPGDMAYFDQDTENLSVKKVIPNNYFTWRNGYYVFDGENFKDIIKKLSRYYNIEIKIENEKLLDMTFSGSLDLKEKPEDVLNIIRRTTPFKIRKEDENKIIVF
ncbi:FecR family protein [Sunxiuqinia sp. A32]|uniref:FecR family protein n=1 Tax=Sunxiuqinia sp. A32 TaxID=3461496 RepID=UPI0040463D45